LPGILLTGATTGYSVVEGNVLTLLLLWFAVRPERPKSKAFHPLRGIVAIAAGFSVLAAAMVLGVVFAEDQRSRGLAAVSAVVGVPGALYSWWLERLRGRPEEGPS
jgi:energy-converting hydrogenase Eha subunit A